MNKYYDYFYFLHVPTKQKQRNNKQKATTIYSALFYLPNSLNFDPLMIV